MITIDGRRWQIQVTMYPIPGGFEVIRRALLIRVAYCEDCYELVQRVAAATLEAAEENKQTA